MEDPADPVKTAAEYRHDDGSVEIVFAVEDGRVLTVREYPDETTFEAAIETAAYAGQHEGVEDLPNVQSFHGPD